MFGELVRTQGTLDRTCERDGAGLLERTVHEDARCAVTGEVLLVIRIAANKPNSSASRSHSGQRRGFTVHSIPRFVPGGCRDGRGSIDNDAPGGAKLYADDLAAGGELRAGALPDVDRRRRLVRVTSRQYL
jgi:hypothetical protein